MPAIVLVKKKVESKKNYKRESFPNREVAVLVNSWKHLYEEIDTFKQLYSKKKLKNWLISTVNLNLRYKSKNKLRNLKDCYENVKDNNKN